MPGGYKGRLTFENQVEGNALPQVLHGLHEDAFKNALARSTRKASRAARNGWDRFCLALNVDPELRGLPVREVETIVGKYLCNEVLVRGLNPQSIIKSYFYLIKQTFYEDRVENQFEAALRQPTFKLVVRGVERMHSERNPTSEVKKLAFTLELVKHLDVSLPRIVPTADSWKEVLRRKALTVGMELGIHFLLRRSEFLPCRTSSGEVSRGIRWSDIQFLDAEGHIIPFKAASLSRVISVSVLVRKSKTDQLGVGRVRTHRRQPTGHCIVAVLVSWALELQSLGAEADSYVFEHSGTPIINDVAIAEAMKAITRTLGLGDNLTSTHSLRYGGATLLAAAGIPAYAITYFGGWAEDSKMIRRYAQLGGEMTESVSRVMSEAFGKSTVDARIRANTLSGK